MLSKKLIASLTAVGAVAAGGLASAASNGTAAAPSTKPAVTAQTQAPAAATAAEPTGGVDTDTLQSGDQTTPDTTKEPAGSEQADANEPAGSEQPGNDGPGGHADEPGNPTADHQFSGAE
jgi:hypothetical protein